MSLGVNINDPSVGTSAKVDTGQNLRVTHPQVSQRLGGETPDPNNVGCVRVFYEKDGGLLTGTPYMDSPYVNEDSRLAVSVDTPQFFETFLSPYQNTSNWQYNNSTMTATQTGGYLVFNNGANTASGTWAEYNTYRNFPFYGNNGTHLEIIGSITSAPLTNQEFYAGFFYGASGTPADGVYFKLTSTALYGCLNYSGTETATSLMASSSLTLNSNAKYKIVYTQNAVEFWINDNLAADIPTPAGQFAAMANNQNYISFLCRNVNTLTGTPMQVKIASVHCDQQHDWKKSNAEILSGMGQMGSQSQGGLATITSTAQLSNSALAAAAALSNTTAAAGNTGLGGAFLVLPTLTAGTDGILCSYQVPTVVGGAKRLVIYGVWISAGVQTVLAGGPLVLAYSLAYGSYNNVSLANTTDSATGKSFRRIPLGIQNFTATAAAGTGTTDIYRRFISPIYINNLEYINVAVRNLGVVTTSGALAITVGFDAAWE